MTANQAMSIGAVGFAVFAVYWITRKTPSGQVSAQPGQAERDFGLGLWNSQLTAQQASIADQAWGHYVTELKEKLS